MTTSTISREELTSIVTTAVIAAMSALDGMNDKPKATKATAKAKATKATPKSTKATAKAKAKREHAEVLDSKRVENIAARALAKASDAGFPVKLMKQGAWLWLYPTNGQGRSAEFKALRLAKGWKYSPKRGAFYRDFS